MRWISLWIVVFVSSACRQSLNYEANCAKSEASQLYGQWKQIGGLPAGESNSEKVLEMNYRHLVIERPDQICLIRVEQRQLIEYVYKADFQLDLLKDEFTLQFTDGNNGTASGGEQRVSYSYQGSCAAPELVLRYLASGKTERYRLLGDAPEYSKPGLCDSTTVDDSEN